MGKAYTFFRMGFRLYIVGMHQGRVFNRHNVPVDGPMLLVSNHQSFADPALVGYGLSREIYYMARDTLFQNAVLARWMTSVNGFPVNREKGDIGAVRASFRMLREGKGVLLFPEGTRSRDGLINRFKPGFALLARKAKVPVVPVVVEGGLDAWPRGRAWAMPLVGMHAAYGKPFTGDEVAEMSTDELIDGVYRRMVELQNDLRERIGKRPYDYSEREA